MTNELRSLCMVAIKPGYGAGYGAPNMQGCGLPLGHVGDHVGEREVARRAATETPVGEGELHQHDFPTCTKCDTSPHDVIDVIREEADTLENDYKLLRVKLTESDTPAGMANSEALDAIRELIEKKPTGIHNVKKYPLDPYAVFQEIERIIEAALATEGEGHLHDNWCEVCQASKDGE